MDNITDVTEALGSIYDDLRSGALKGKEAKEMNNALGKMINAAKVQLEYKAMTKHDVEIEFLKPQQSTNKE